MVAAAALVAVAVAAVAVVAVGPVVAAVAAAGASLVPLRRNGKAPTVAMRPMPGSHHQRNNESGRRVAPPWVQCEARG